MADANPVRTVHVRITGTVQGVYYRAWAAENARELGLSGWVRNRRDGTVEAVFSGDPEAVETMIKHCKAGPTDAAVIAVEIMSEGGSAPDGFSVWSTT
jgi:acylphosphatase